MHRSSGIKSWYTIQSGAKTMEKENGIGTNPWSHESIDKNQKMYLAELNIRNQ